MKLLDIGLAHVKCTRFLTVPHARLERHGIQGDRQFILLDRHGAPMASHHHKFFTPLTFLFDSASDELSLTYPDGRTIRGNGAGRGPVFSLDYMGMRNVDVRDVDGQWNGLLSDFSGMTVRMVRPVSPGGGIDVLPITFFTTGSLAMLSERIGQHVDPRRFRANLVIECAEPFVEDLWEQCQLQVGEVILRVRSKVPRCVVTQSHPDTGDNDLSLVPALAKFREKVQLPDGLMPSYATPPFASYAEVVREGVLQQGDEVRLI